MHNSEESWAFSQVWNTNTSRDRGFSIHDGVKTNANRAAFLHLPTQPRAHITKNPNQLSRFSRILDDTVPSTPGVIPTSTAWPIGILTLHAWLSSTSSHESHEYKNDLCRASVPAVESQSTGNMVIDSGNLADNGVTYSRVDMTPCVHTN